MACSLINHKEEKLDTTKVDFLIDFANDAEDKVWQKAITYLVLVLNHLGNQWLRFPSIQTKLKHLKDHKEIQEALKDILKIMQFEFKSSSFVGEKVFENDYFKDYPFNYFMPFYENNPSIGNLYNRGDIEVEELVKFLYSVPLPDSFKYLVCNSNDFILTKIDHSSESDIKYLQSLSILSAYDPYLNYINEIFSFYKNTQNKIVLNEKISIISVKNINEHLLNAIEQYRAMARQFIVEKNWGTAITYLNALLKLSPDDIEALLALIQCYDINEKTIDDRLKLRKQIENILPKMDENLFQIGNLLVDEEKYKDAINYYNKAIEINQKEADYYFNRGSAKKDLKKYEEAILDYDRAIKMDASDANYHCNRGEAKYWLKYYNEAIIDLDKAIEIEPKNAVFYTFRGLAKRDSNDFNGAIIDFDKGIELNPKNEIAYSAKSNLFRLLLKLDEAHDLINIAIRLDSNASNNYGTKAAIFSSQNNEEGFYKYAEIAFEKKAKAYWFDDDVKEKYRNEPRFQALLAKYNLSLDEEE